MKSKNILLDFTIEDLQEQHKEFAEVMGVENLVKMSKAFGGNHIYIPQEKELIKNKIYKAISQEFDGTNKKKLALKYHVFESTVYNIIRKQAVKKAAFEDNGI